MKLLAPFFIVLSVAAHAQTSADTAVSQMRKLLTPGKHVVHYVLPDPDKGLTPEQKALKAKVLKVMMENADWIRDSLRSVSSPQAMMDALRQKTGLTQEEWTEYQDLASVSSRGYKVFGEDQLEIVVDGGQMSFRGTGSAQAMDSVRLDLATNTVLYREQRLPFARIGRSSAAENAFHTPTIGYEYEMRKTSMADSTDIKSMHMETYDFGVVQFTETGKTAITLMAIKVDGSNFLPSANVALMMLLD